MAMRVEIIPVLHSVMSAQRVVECARTAYGLGFKIFVVSRALGTAAQSGVPDAQKMALKMGKSFAYLSDLDDVIEVFNPNAVLLVVPQKYGGEPAEEVLKKLNSGKVALVFSGSEPGFSRRELEKGTPIYFKGIVEDIGSVALFGIGLYLALKILT